MLSLAASVEQASPHVLAATLVREARHRGLALVEPTGVVEQPGTGVSGVAAGRKVWVGAVSGLVEDEFGDWLSAAAIRISDDIVPHERTDESQIYAKVAERLGGDDPLVAMSRTHQEIFHLAALLGRLVDDATVYGFGATDRGEARRILYALDAILRLHFAQEEELLSSMALATSFHLTTEAGPS